MSDALEYAKRAIKSEDDHPGVDPHVLLLARAVVRQDEELAALKEKYRWRKQSEEPVGDSLEDDAPVECLDMEYGIPTTRVTECKIVGPEEYWRPLDLPEEEM